MEDPGHRQAEGHTDRQTGNNDGAAESAGIRLPTTLASTHIAFMLQSSSGDCGPSSGGALQEGVMLKSSLLGRGLGSRHFLDETLLEFEGGCRLPALNP